MENILAGCSVASVCSQAPIDFFMYGEQDGIKYGLLPLDSMSGPGTDFDLGLGLGFDS